MLPLGGIAGGGIAGRQNGRQMRSVMCTIPSTPSCSFHDVAILEVGESERKHFPITHSGEMSEFHPSHLTISPALPCSRIFRIIDPAAALYGARNIYDTGIELRGRTASARGTDMENTGVGHRVGRDV